MPQLNYNFTYLKNEVLEVNNAAGFLPGPTFALGGTVISRMQTGLPLGGFYGLVADGIFQNQAEVDAHATQSGAQPGDIRYRDLDGDGEVEFGSDDDLTLVGNPIPDFVMGFGFNTQVKDFDFGFSLYASIGNEAVRAYERFLPYSNRLDYYLGRWTGEGTSNEVPRASNAAANNFNVFSSFYVEDASFLRIQNMQLGYSLPEKFSEKLNITKLRVYFSVNNLYTFTNYRGYDPEITNSNPLAAGIDFGQYPQARTFFTGLNITF